MPRAWDPPHSCKNREANLAAYQMYANAYKGGNWVTQPPAETRDPSFRDGRTLSDSNGQNNSHGLSPNSYLRTLPKEREKEYAERLRRAYYPNYCQEVVRVYVSTLFREGYSIDRSAVLEALGEDIAKNIDRLGRDVNSFLRAVDVSTLQYGWVGVITDKLPAPPGGFESAAEEAEADQRPYSRIVLPTQLWDWEIDPDDGDWTYLLIHEGQRRIDPKTGRLVDSGGELRDVWKIWTRERWALVDQEGQQLAGAKHSRKRIPFDLCICDEADAEADDEPFGHAALRDVANLNLEIFQQMSLLEDLARKTNWPGLFGKGNPVEIQQTTAGAKKADGSGPEVGPGYMMIAPIDFAWKAPPPTCMQVGMEYVAELRRELRRIAGIATNSEESTEAHSGAALQWEYSTRHDLVKARAENVRDFEVRLWRTYADYLNSEKLADVAAAVKYPTTYATAPVPQDLSELESMQKVGMPDEIIRAQKRSIVVKRFSHLPNLQELLDAVDAEEEPTPAPAPAPMPPPPPEPELEADEAKEEPLAA